MAVGLHTTNVANAMLNVLGGTTFAGIASTYVKLHTGDPGVGTGNPSGTTTRVVLSWAAAVGGSKAIQATLPSWSSWAAGNETISHISIWDNISSGNFLYGVQLTTPKAVTNGDTLNLTSHSVSLAPLAA